MSDSPEMYLLNCRSCDDIQLLVDKSRTCECGASHGNMVKSRPVLTGSARLIAISWESYDMAGAGNVGQWRIAKG